MKVFFTWLYGLFRNDRAWLPMETAPRDGTVIEIRFGSDWQSPAWWDLPISPIQNDDGTWPRELHGHPWAFVDGNTSENKKYFINHATDKPLYGPSHWRPYKEQTP